MIYIEALTGRPTNPLKKPNVLVKEKKTFQNWKKNKVLKFLNPRYSNLKEKQLSYRKRESSVDVYAYSWWLEEDGSNAKPATANVYALVNLGLIDPTSSAAVRFIRPRSFEIYISGRDRDFINYVFNFEKLYFWF